MTEQERTFQTLTKREQEVLKLIALGEPNKTIAAALGIAKKTVEKHRQSLMHKTNRHCIAKLTRLAVALGLATAE